MCTSLQAEFAVDAVILPHSTGRPGAVEASLASAAAVRQAAPWLRRIFVMDKNTPGKDAPAAPPYARPEATEGIVLCDPETLRSAATACLPQEDAGQGEAPVKTLSVDEGRLASLPVDALLHAVPGIAEQFIVMHAPASAKVRSPLDYFTPNGIPLIYVQWVPTETASCSDEQAALAAMRAKAALPQTMDWPPLPYAYPQTRECAASFFPGFTVIAEERLRAFADAPLEPADYVFPLAQWMFATKRGILSPLLGTGTPKAGLM